VLYRVRVRVRVSVTFKIRIIIRASRVGVRVRVTIRLTLTLTCMRPIVFFRLSKTVKKVIWPKASSKGSCISGRKYQVLICIG
jgi:hypothetical protein